MLKEYYPNGQPRAMSEVKALLRPIQIFDPCMHENPNDLNLRDDFDLLEV